MFDDDFINSLPDDPIEGTIEICNRIIEYYEDGDGLLKSYQGFMEGNALLSSFLEANELFISLPTLGHNRANNAELISNTAIKIKSQYEHQIDTQSIEQLKKKFQARLKSGFAYEFTEGDLKRIQVLINELRELISNFHAFKEEHRQRLLKRLEKLQGELHKRVSDLDRIWGLLGDFGAILRKFGHDAKPITDRLREIIEIGWRTQSRTEELPSGTKPPLLESDNE